MMAKAKPSSFHELMKIAGLSHGTGVWTNNAENLLKQGIALDRIVAYREDIFNYIHDKASECGLSVDGLALQVMEDVRCGRYANSEQGIPNEIKEMLREVRAEEWFITSIKKMSYLFPKINGVEMVRNAALLMWYKMNDPAKFNETISSNT
jgi:DNA polymerase-3 subunit alpha (Gram-positive type)